MAKKITPLKLERGTPLKRLNYTTAQTRSLMSEFAGLKSDFAANTFENLYAGIVNPYADMENVFEEGEIAMKGYESQKDVLAEGLATTLESQRTSGGDINVQAIANALTKQSRDISANIEQQEVTQNRLAQQEASRLQGLERQGELQAQMMRIKGAEDQRNLRLQQQQALLTLVSGQIQAGKAEDYKTKGWLSKLLNIF
jgi:hypothetical protein